MASDVHGRPACRAQAGAISDTLAGDVKGRTVVGTGANHRQSRCKIDPFPEGKALEWHQPLVVVHRQNAVEMPIATGTKKAVGTEGPLNGESRLL